MPGTACSAYVLLNGLLFIGLGAAYLAAPAWMAGKTDYVLSSDAAVVEVRTFYGGMEVALGLLLCFCAFRGGWLMPGLVLTVVLYGGFAGGRLFGVLASRRLGGIIWKLLTVELADFALGLALLVGALREVLV